MDDGNILGSGRGLPVAERPAVARSQPATDRAAASRRAGAGRPSPLRLEDGGREGVAWPTVALAVCAVAGHAGVCAAALAGLLPLWAGAIANTLLAYLAFTPMHEASHGNVNGREAGLAWLNEAVGWATGVLLLSPFSAFRALHLRHHAATNDPERDPDYWVASRHPLSIAFRCATIIVEYHVAYLRGVAEGSTALARRRRASILGMLLELAVIVVLWSVGLGVEALALWIGPALVATTVLAFLFDWLPHHPHDRRGRYLDTRILLAPALTLPTLWQNHHLIHHLYPRAPFYRYASIFRAQRPELVERGARIVALTRAGWLRMPGSGLPPTD